MASGLRGPRRGAVRATVAAAVLVIPAPRHRRDQLLEPGLPHEQFNSRPIGPLEILIFPAFKKPAVHGQDARQIERIVHGGQFFEVGQFVRYLDIQIAGWRFSENLSDETVNQLRE